MIYKTDFETQPTYNHLDYKDIMAKNLIIPVILCGGSGTRLWPSSRENHPKQFLPLMDDFSLLQNTMRRALRASGAEASSLVTVTLGAMKDAVIEHLAEIDPAATTHILCEPSARNTAAAVALAAAYVQKTFGDDAMLWILPADHHIGNEQILAQSFQHALVAANNGRLVTFGINPTRPDTGYGYIRVGDADATGRIHAVKQFVEKPNLETAQSYLENGGYLWNSGMFLFSAKTVLAEFEAYSANILNDVIASMAATFGQPEADAYAAIEKQPFDKAIMEKSSRVAVVPCNPEWSDIGSWESLWDIRDKDHNDNVIEGRAACFNAKGCLVQGNDSKLIAIAGLDNIVVVETEDAILITNKSDNDSMKSLVQGLKDAGAIEAIEVAAPPAQPWSLVQTIETEKTLQAQELALASGEQRTFVPQEEGLCLYTILEGSAEISMNGETKSLKAYESIDVQTSLPYAIKNTGKGDLKMIAVQKNIAEGIFFGTQDARKVA